MLIFDSGLYNCCVTEKHEKYAVNIKSSKEKV